MITVKLTSGLGNQMFQYAAGFAVAHRNNVKLNCDISVFKNYRANTTHRNFGLDKFNITARVVNKRPLLSYRCLHDIKDIANNMIYGHKWVIKEANQKYDNGIFGIKGSCYLQGYWQNEKYFIDCKDEICKEFQFKEKLQAPEGNSVAIHIRRGDYVIKFTRTHLVCTPLYYENAIAYIQGKVENPVFYVFSEDVEWCIENVKIPEPCFYINNSDKLPSHDMQLMSLCKHNIISNSSYSWWAAWLNQNPDKIIIAPEKWFADGRETDIYTSNMVKISTTEESRL